MAQVLALYNFTFYSCTLSAKSGIILKCCGVVSGDLCKLLAPAAGVRGSDGRAYWAHSSRGLVDGASASVCKYTQFAVDTSRKETFHAGNDAPAVLLYTVSKQLVFDSLKPESGSKSESATKLLAMPLSQEDADRMLRLHCWDEFYKRWTVSFKRWFENYKLEKQDMKTATPKPTKAPWVEKKSGSVIKDKGVVKGVSCSDRDQKKGRNHSLSLRDEFEMCYRCAFGKNPYWSWRGTVKNESQAAVEFTRNAVSECCKVKHVKQMYCICTTHGLVDGASASESWHIPSYSIIFCSRMLYVDMLLEWLLLS